MNILIRLIMIVAFFATLSPALAQQRSAKRGVGWDEKTLKMTDDVIERIAPGVSWVYNWGIQPQGPTSLLDPQPSTLDSQLSFYPMCWNGGFNETALRQYLSAHPGTKYLLGFNEPNFSAQSNMTPEAAAKAWEKVEKVAADYDMLLVAPALNFTGEKVGGRTWNPYEWYDEFFRLRPDAKVDCLALHCYMNWYGASTWFATEYFYKDLYDSSKKDAYGRYPNLTAFLDRYKEAHGHFPRMMLTEFCSWENDGTITGVDFQIDQMTQKVQKLEQSDLVEGYAWFMLNGTASAYPYWSILKTCSATSPLSTLGEVYIYMSSFDTQRWYAPGETILAKDYIDASTDAQQAKLRPNTDQGSTAPLQVLMQPSAWTKYQVDVPVAGDYNITLRMQSTTDHTVYVYLDDKRQKPAATLPSTKGTWSENTFKVTLPAGQHTLMLFNTTQQTFLFDEFRYEGDTEGIVLPTCPTENLKTTSYDFSGRPTSQSGLIRIEVTDGARKRVIR